jgi:hypothetical protein
MPSGSLPGTSHQNQPDDPHEPKQGQACSERGPRQTCSRQPPLDHPTLRSGRSDCSRKKFIKAFPDTIERVRHQPRIAHGVRDECRTRLQDHLRYRHCLLGMALLDAVLETFVEIRLGDDPREVHRQRLGKRAHPIVRHHLDNAPSAQRTRIEALRQLDEPSGLRVEMAAQLFGITKLLVLQHQRGADVPEGARQLIMMRVTARQTVIVDKDLQLALAQGGAVEMRQVIDRGAGKSSKPAFTLTKRL